MTHPVCVDQVCLLTRAKRRRIQLQGRSLSISSAIPSAIPAAAFGSRRDKSPAKLRLNKPWRRFLYADTTLYESMVPLLSRSPISVCAVADTR